MNEYYFLVFFIGHKEDGTISGNVPLSCENKFLNRNETVKIIEDSAKISKVVITNIIKLSEYEYTEWCRIS